MAIVTTNDIYYKDIADVLRYNLNTNAKFKPDEMVRNINEACSNRYTDGLSEGYAQGKQEGITEGYNQGVIEGETAYLDSILNGKKNVGYAFYRWGVEYIRPSSVYKPTDGYSSNVFYFCNHLKKVEKQYLDFSKTKVGNSSNGAYCTFYGCDVLEEIEDINIPTQNTYYMTWGYCPNLKKIELIRSKKETTYTNPFQPCEKLSYVRFDGVIGQNISFSWCPLDEDSIKDIIEHLYDYSTEAPGTKTITFSRTMKTRLANIQDLHPSGVTWEERISELGWNLA